MRNLMKSFLMGGICIATINFIAGPLSDKRSKAIGQAVRCHIFHKKPFVI